MSRPGGGPAARDGRARRAGAAGGWALAAAAVALAAGTMPTAAQEAGGEAAGKAVYDKWCAGCHGVEGDGNGPAAHYMLPRPRDFTRALYQVRTTPSGQVPTDEDILHVIDVGMPNTAMPGWEETLTRAEREALVPYLKSFSRFFTGEEPQPMEFGRAPGGGDEAIARGAEIYQEVECWQCHGQAGRGDGTSAPTLEDDAGQPIYAANLRKSWTFNGGGTVEDIYRRLRTGLDGTPMPTFDDLISAGIVTEDGLWDLAHYVRSLSPERAPAVREVIRAELLEEGELPTAVDDERWAEVDRFYVPLVGQIILKPRWFSPRVNNLWVQALHDGEEVALLVSWADPSRSPAPAWADFASAVQEAMEPKGEGDPWAPGAPDQLVVQFPQTVPTGMERPYFLQGDARRPAYLWRWRSEPDEVAELVARGMGTGVEQEAASRQVSAVSGWAEGEWRVLFRRSVTTADSAQDLQLPLGQAVPVAFQAWDGDNAEAGNRAAVSTWYFLALEQATPVTVFVAPALAMILTAGLGLLVVARAQKREREGAGHG